MHYVRYWGKRLQWRPVHLSIPSMQAGTGCQHRSIIYIYIYFSPPHNYIFWCLYMSMYIEESIERHCYCFYLLFKIRSSFSHLRESSKHYKFYKFTLFRYFVQKVVLVDFWRSHAFYACTNFATVCYNGWPWSSDGLHAPWQPSTSISIHIVRYSVGIIVLYLSINDKGHKQPLTCR